MRDPQHRHLAPICRQNQIPDRQSLDRDVTRPRCNAGARRKAHGIGRLVKTRLGILQFKGVGQQVVLANPGIRQNWLSGVGLAKLCRATTC